MNVVWAFYAMLVLPCRVVDDVEDVKMPLSFDL